MVGERTYRIGRYTITERRAFEPTLESLALPRVGARDRHPRRRCVLSAAAALTGAALVLVWLLG